MPSHTTRAARWQLIFSLALFGTVGLFVRSLRIPVSVLASTQGFIGASFLYLLLRAGGKRPDRATLQKRLPLLLLSGSFIGINWLLLFEAYQYTTIATATLCNYFSPVFVVLLSPFLLKERLTPVKLICVFTALGGMFLLSGFLEQKAPTEHELLGMLLGTGSAVFYALMVLLNKRLSDISPYDRTIVQLLAASATVLPYALHSVSPAALSFSPLDVLLIATIGIVHIGFCYVLYFGAFDRLSAQSISALSYLDPVVAVLVSAIVLREPMSLFAVLGAICILGSSFVSVLTEK